jgi:hypothetical protein
MNLLLLLSFFSLSAHVAIIATKKLCSALAAKREFKTDQ